MGIVREVMFIGRLWFFWCVGDFLVVLFGIGRIVVYV